MILDTHVDLVRDIFVNSSWSNYRLETSLNIIPRLINPRFPLIGNFEYQRGIYKLPTNDKYDVYCFAYTPQELLQTSTLNVGKWLTLAEFADLHKIILHVSYRNKLTIPLLNETYVMRLVNGSLLLAVKYVPSQIGVELQTHLRTSGLEPDIDCNMREVKLINQTLVGNEQLIFNNITENFNRYYIDGVYQANMDHTKIQLNKTLTIHSDTGIGLISNIDIDQLDTYTVDTGEWYLLPISNDETRTFNSRMDSVYYIINGDIGRRLYLDKNSLAQITDTYVGIKTSTIESLLNSIGWRKEDCGLRIYTKTNNITQHYFNNENFLFSINRLPPLLRKTALVGNDDTPIFIEAKSLHKNDFNLGIDLPYRALNKTELDKIIGISAWDGYLNKTIINSDLVTNDLTGLGDYPGGCKLIASFSDGNFNELFPTTKENTNKFLLGYINETTIHTGNGVAVNGFAKIAVFNKLPSGELKILSMGEDYAVVGGEMVHKSHVMGDVFTLDLNSTYVKELDPNVRLIDLPLHNDLELLGNIALLGNNRVLIKDIDYIIADNKLSISYGLPITRLIFIFQPTVNASNQIIASGFTKDNTLQLSSSYTDMDPENIQINVDGKLYFFNEIEWLDDFTTSTNTLPNGKPFQITKFKLNNTSLGAKDLYDIRLDYENKLNLITQFKDLHLPRVDTSISVFNEHYRVLSIFFFEVYKAAVAGTINFSNENILVNGLDRILEDYLPLLKKLDITGKLHPQELLDVVASPSTDLIEVTSSVYEFLEKVNFKYLNNKVVLNQAFRIGFSN